MNFIELVWKFLRLKALQTQDWAERKLAAAALSVKLMLAFYLVPFFAAIIIKAFGASDGAASLTFGIGLLGTMVFMAWSAARIGALAALTHGAGKLIDRLSSDDDEAPKTDAQAQAKSLSGTVMRTLLKGYGWMLYVGVFYMLVPLWRDFILYVASLGITCFVTYYVLGYPEDNKPEYRKVLFRIALIAFMGIAMISLGVMRFALDAGESAWQKLPSIMLFSSAVALLLACFFCFIGAAMAHEPGKGALKLAGKVTGIAGVVLAAIVLLFGDMTWLQFREKYADVKAVPRAVEAAEKATSKPGELKPGDAPAASSGDSAAIGDQGYNVPAPYAKSPEPAKPGNKKGKSANTDAPEATADNEPASKPAERSTPTVKVRKTPHQGDELDQVTDLLDEVANRRATAGL